MTFIPLSYGEIDVKNFGYERKLAIPVMGVFGRGIGVGLKFSDGRIVSAAAKVPRLILCSYRAMKLVERLKYVTLQTLHDCWLTFAPQVIQPPKIEIDNGVIMSLSGEVPENLDEIITKLSGLDILVAGWEIIEEIKNGKVPETPILKTFLDKYREESIAYSSEHRGSVIPSETSLLTVSEMGSKASNVVETYKKKVTSAKAVKFRNNDDVFYYVIGNDKQNPSIEVTLRGAKVYYGSESSNGVSIFFEYNGCDNNFEPRDEAKAREDSHACEKTFLGKWYGGSVKLRGSTKNPTLKTKVIDYRVEECVKSFVDALQKSGF